MATVERQIDAGPDQVFAVLADGWAFPAWVVGASHLRAVDPAWPLTGSRLHHSVGAWPVLLQDETVVESVDPGRRLVLTARGRPLGTARVDLRLTAAGAATVVTMVEEPVAGPGRWLHNPVLDAVLAHRNVESLKRLAALVERPSEP